jgi:hypothetical protein
MRKLLLMASALGLSAATAMAQTAPSQGIPNQVVSNDTNQAIPLVKPKTVKKRVCEKVEVERSTGSRLSSTTRLCKVVEVPAPQTDTQPVPNEGSTERH